MPTVATKNGGPVDIMKTLHHGVTVDPTNERELGNALLEILTHPATWQEMSRNGPSSRWVSAHTVCSTKMAEAYV